MAGGQEMASTNPFRLSMLLGLLFLVHLLPVSANALTNPRQAPSRPSAGGGGGGRERVSVNAGWRFQRFTSSPDNATYNGLKQWILPAANDFIRDATKRYKRPTGQSPTATYAQAAFDDSAWEALNLPHDWAVKGPFYEGANTPVTGGMGRLPSQGIGWYRRKITVRPEDSDKSTYLEVDGAMSYAIVWLNGVLVGGWPYGYASFRLDLTPYIKAGENVLAIRVENALSSSRWYPGAGIYRNVWLTRVSPTHVGQYGTWITSRQVSAQSATLDLVVQVENNDDASAAAAAKASGEIQVVTDVHVYDPVTGRPVGDRIAQFPWMNITVGPGQKQSVNSSVAVPNPRLWGPKPSQEPNMYVAVTRLWDSNGGVIDTYETRFGIRTVSYGGDGLSVNGKRVYLQGVSQHHDLGALGSAQNIRALQRQLETLQEMGCNSIRTTHNPPTPELLALADEMGMLIVDEIFDTWASSKTTNDFSKIFADWSEADLRSFVRRDRNHPSVAMWSYGNEVAEQGRGDAGAATVRRLKDITKEEDPTRLGTTGMNSASATTPFVAAVDIIGLNYQGEGLGSGPATFDNFRSRYPNKMIFSTESSSAISTRGTYMFPVVSGVTSNVRDGQGGDPRNRYVSAYELYAVDWGSSPDKVFAAQDRYPYVGGEFVWTGWDYIGEPTPYDLSRSSYFGIIDLAGFKKDRFWLYQARWNPEVRMAHVLPHWTWPGREGQVTPVHAFSSGDEAELFVNGATQGRVKRAEYTYRFRWDKVVYQPGEVKVVAYKGGKEWASETVRTVGAAKALKLTVYRDRSELQAADDDAGFVDMAFVNVAVVDERGDVVPQAKDAVTFAVTKGPGEIVATDNGDPTDMNPFPAKERKAFSGKAMAFVRLTRAAKKGDSVTVSASAKGLQGGEVVFTVT